jgi:hypothetical protein
MVQRVNDEYKPQRSLFDLRNDVESMEELVRRAHIGDNLVGVMHDRLLRYHYTFYHHGGIWYLADHISGDTVKCYSIAELFNRVVEIITGPPPTDTE